MAIGFGLLFVLIGLTVFFVAMRGGARGAREALHAQSRRASRTVIGVVGLVFVVCGVAVPALVLATNESGHSRSAPAGTELTAAQQHGRELFAQSCATCHALKAANAVGRVGPDLDAIRPPAALVLDAIANGRARGTGQMPADLLSGEDAKDVARFVARVAGR